MASPGPPPTEDAVSRTEHAFLELRLRLRGFVSRRVRRDVDDIVQTVFLRLHRSLGARRRIDDLPAFVFAMARNAIVDHHRSFWSRRVRTAGDAEALGSRGGHHPREDGEGAHARAARCLPRMLGRLSESDRRALVEVDLRGLTQLAAARSSGLSLPGMKARVQRARARLQRLYLESCRVGRDGRGGLVSCHPKDQPGLDDCPT